MSCSTLAAPACPVARKHAGLQSVALSVLIVTVKVDACTMQLPRFFIAAAGSRESRDSHGLETMWPKFCLLTKNYIHKPQNFYQKLLDINKYAQNSRLVRSRIQIMDHWIFNRPSCFLELLLSAWSRLVAMHLNSRLRNHAHNRICLFTHRTDGCILAYVAAWSPLLATVASKASTTVYVTRNRINKTTHQTTHPTSRRLRMSRDEMYQALSQLLYTVR